MRENGCHIVTPVCVHHKEGVVMIDILDILTYIVNRLGLKCKRGDLVLKGGLALEDKLRIAAPDFLRYTHDIDLHVGSVETYTEVFGDIELWLNRGTDRFAFKTAKVRDFKNGSAGFDFIVTDGADQAKVGIYLNVAPMHIISIDYSDTFNIPTYDIYTMLADKMAVMCNRVVFRRIKDLYDIYAILHLTDISYPQLWQRVERKRPGVVSRSTYMLPPPQRITIICNTLLISLKVSSIRITSIVYCLWYHILCLSI